MSKLPPNMALFAEVGEMVNELAKALEPENRDIPWLEAMRYPLLLRVVQRLTLPESETSRSKVLSPPLWKWRYRLQRIRRRTFQARISTKDTVLLPGSFCFFPRTLAHLPDMVAISQTLRDKHAQSVATFTTIEQLHKSLAAMNEPYSSIEEFSADLDRQDLSQSTALFLKWRAALETTLPKQFYGLSSDQVIREFLIVFQTHWFHLLELSKRIHHLFRQIQPRLIFVGNHYALEGKLISLLAKRYQILSVCIQHGGVLEKDPQWEGAWVDLMLAWGESSAQIMRTCGLPHVEVSGSPGLDSIFRSTRSGSFEKPKRLLVATSGVGDLVSLEEHLAFIKILIRAAEESPDLEWIVKLNRKDREDYYVNGHGVRPKNLILRRGSWGSRLGRLEIYDYLEKVSALITVSSSAGLDALVMDLPVIAIDTLPPEAAIHRHDYFKKGSVQRVNSYESLLKAARLATSDLGLQGEFREQARAYIRDYYAYPRRSTEKACEIILKSADKLKGSKNAAVTC